LFKMSACESIPAVHRGTMLEYRQRHRRSYAALCCRVWALLALGTSPAILRRWAREPPSLDSGGPAAVHSAQGRAATSSGRLRRHRSVQARPALLPTALRQGPDNFGLPILDGTDVSERYIRLSPREHILLRPDTYIGSVEPVEKSTWLLREDGLALESRVAVYSPGFLKIFDEILVNAMDQQFAVVGRKQARTTEIAVDVDKGSGIITVRNDGAGIPVEKHKEYQDWVPTFIFGELLTGSNFDDHAGPRFVGGRNGVGAKATNVFSEWFEIEVVDQLSARRFVQRWSNNMRSIAEPEVSEAPDATTGLVQVRFLPDFARFGMTGIDDSTFELLRSRVIDAAACTQQGVGVKFNGEEVGVRTFTDYARLVMGVDGDTNLDVAKVQDDTGTVRLEVAVGISENSGFQAVGFVNGIRCHEGTHIEHIVKQLTAETISKLGKSKKDAPNIQPRFVREHLILVVKVLVESPSFASQSKEQLETPVSKYGFAATLPSSFLKKVVKSGLAKIVQAYATFKDNAGSERKLERKMLGALPPKLEDAVHAGVEGEKCTLILTEGDSAKAMALGALEGCPECRQNFGIFPLKGKIMNVRDAKPRTLAASSGVQELMQIIGLKLKQEYDSVAAPSLRYQEIMVFADQDPDGDHITGLIINIFASLWPSILAAEPRFIVKFGTPLVKVMNYPLGTEFFSMQEWENWATAHMGAKPVPIPKYYKGLGTSSDSEAATYFQNLDRHTLALEWHGESDAAALELAFSNRCASERKSWLLHTYDPSSFLDYSQECATHREFIDRGLIHFSMYDCQRSIPHLMDGFKPSQRKAIFAARKVLRSEMKVAAFTSVAMQETRYHHGEAAMTEAIIRLAQNHVGTNNINYLVPIGQFGSRLHDRSEHAQARYIGTRLETITSTVFRQEDDAILNYETDELVQIEPQYFFPVLPSILLNGASGIGTGWSTDVLAYHPEELAKAMRHVLSGNLTPQLLMPWFDGFNGEIYRHSDGRFMSAGRWSVGTCNKARRRADSIEITELPVGTWTDTYKEWLHTTKALQGVIQSIDSSHSGKAKVHLVLHCEPKKLQAFLRKNSKGDKLGRALGLVKSLQSQMWLWNASGKLEFFEDTDAVIRSFYAERLPMYKKRRIHMIEAAERQLLRLRQKHHFIRHVVDGSLQLSPAPSRETLEGKLQQLGLEPFSSQDGSKDSEPSYDYLLNLKFMSLTKENAEELEAELGRQEAELTAMRQRTAEQCWRKDLDDFSKAYKAFRPTPPAETGHGKSVLDKTMASVGPEGTTLGLEDLLGASKSGARKSGARKQPLTRKRRAPAERPGVSSSEQAS